MDNTPPQPPLPPSQPPSQPQPQPLSLSPPLAIQPYNRDTSHVTLPFPPPTTPSSSSATASNHKKRRSKLLCVDTKTNINSENPTKRQSRSTSTEVVPPCTECGKTFWSMKALFGHMRCHPERLWRGIHPPLHLHHQPLPPTPTTNDREVAASLLLLASRPSFLDTPASPSSSVKFECSSCKKTFGSHQALGGHRASHKNVKGCFAIAKNTTDIDESHEESVGLGLSLGLGVVPTRQALDGHRRCQCDKSSEEKHKQAQASSSSFGLGLGPVSRPSEAQCGLDLNLPTPVVDDGSSPPLRYSKNTQLDLRLGL